MKRLQIMIDEEVDTELGRRAAREGTSKAALIRRFVGREVQPLSSIEDDPIWELAGDCEFDPVADIDEYLYGPIEAPEPGG